MLLQKVGFNEDSLKPFLNLIRYDDKTNCYYFSYHERFKVTWNIEREEELHFNLRNFVPSNFYQEININDDLLISKVYIFKSCLDAISFFQIKKISFAYSLFVIVGSNPRFEIFENLKKRLPNAKYYLVFPKTLFGALADIKSALSLLGFKEVNFLLKDDYLHLSFNSKYAKIHIEELSLARVRKTLNISAPFKTYKPKEYQCYFEKLIKQRHYNEITN